MIITSPHFPIGSIVNVNHHITHTARSNQNPIMTYLIIEVENVIYDIGYVFDHDPNKFHYNGFLREWHENIIDDYSFHKLN